MTHIGWYGYRLRAKIFERWYWKRRNLLARLLEENGFSVKEYDNPYRLHAFIADEEFIIDCQQVDIFRTGYTSVKWVNQTTEPVIFIDIPDSGIYGIENKDSRYRDKIDQIMRSVYDDPWRF